MSGLWNLGRRSFKVIGTDTNRSVTYDFLLTFHSNHGPISYRFRDKRQFQLKIANFSHPVTGFPLGIGYRRKDQKTRVMWLLGRTRSLMITSAVWMQSTNVTAGQTDSGRQQLKTALTHSVALAVKTTCLCVRARARVCGLVEMQSADPEMGTGQDRLWSQCWRLHRLRRNAFYVRCFWDDE